MFCYGSEVNFVEERSQGAGLGNPDEMCDGKMWDCLVVVPSV